MNGSESEEANTLFGHKSVKQSLFDGYMGRSLNTKEWLQAVRCGCAWCGTVPEVEEAQATMWVARDTFVCSECSKDDYVTTYLKQAY